MTTDDKIESGYRDVWGQEMPDFRNPEIITIEPRQLLKDKKILIDFYYHIKREELNISFNGEYDGVKVIFRFDHKDWSQNPKKIKGDLEPKGVSHEIIEEIVKSLNDYHDRITASKELLDKTEKEERKEARVSNNNRKEKLKLEYPINKFSQGTPLLESILVDNIPYFIEITNSDKNEDGFILHEKYELPDIVIVPPQRTEYLGRPQYSFKSKTKIKEFLELAKKQNLDSLFTTVKGILKLFIDMDDDFINVLASDVIFTYFQDKLGMTHYLLIVGDNNSGKSSILLTFSWLGYRAVLETSITPANMYNFGSQIEQGQHIIIEDELGNIDEQPDKKRMYQVSYYSGTTVTRIYDNASLPNTIRKSTRQQSFFLYCFKMSATEEKPDKVKSKGFLQRFLELKPVVGYPQYDITEIVDDSGDEEFKKLYQELIDTRKLLLMYKLLHNNDTIPNIELNIKNRYKQLTKPVIRLFQNTESLGEIKKSLSKYIIEKNEEKIDSLDSELLDLVRELVKETDAMSDGKVKLFNDQIWKKIQTKYPDGTVEKTNSDGTVGEINRHSWYLEGLGIISKKKLTGICEEKFMAKRYRDRALGRSLIFDPKVLDRIFENYEVIGDIEIVEKKDGENSNNHDNP